MITKGLLLVVALLIAGGASIQAVSLIPPQAAAAGKILSDGEVDEATSEVTYSPIASGMVKDANVNVRGRPSFLGEVLVKLQKGDTVTILEEITRTKPAKGEPTNWFRISLPANTPVWVFSDYVDSQSKTVKANRLNFRGGAGENYSILGRLNKGATVTILTTRGNWTQIEAPAAAFAFVAADLIETQTAPEPTPAPAPEPPPAPEIVAVPAEPIIADPEPALAIDEPVPVIIAEPAPPVIVSPPPAPEEVLVKRVVTREGIVRRARNIQSPTYFELESIDSGKMINYLHSPETMKVVEDGKPMQAVPDLDLVPYVGRRVMVTGEEFMDKRWKRTPVINVEVIDLQQ
ncbi:MAG: SH3 domain-containing protein [Verrucomicrobia bacterium]|nr:SH3 domain-containing protein [Verrucomicrobiota bacterium]